MDHEEQHADDVDAALQAADVMMRVAARSVSEVEDIVTSPQLRVLVMVATRGPQTLGGVAAELGVHASNATRTCEKLVRLGLVERTEDPDDRRFVRVTLTSEGRALVERVIGHRRSALAEVLAEMEPGERNAAAASFRAFANAAGDLPNADGRFTLLLPGAAAGI
ncbi:MarR family winged helix-turn-helix transcriptional regulator [Leifsonia sp. L25]|uniref:MarR family winged helix-turn-helix transcriptional regulator n=1 Tax=Actinomycetes TaxID=1760 RepID=UPI003D68DA1A